MGFTQGLIQLVMGILVIRQSISPGTIRQLLSFQISQPDKDRPFCPGLFIRFLYHRKMQQEFFWQINGCRPALTFFPALIAKAVKDYSQHNQPGFQPPVNTTENKAQQQ